MTPAESGYCIWCGERLSPDHRFCWACGAERWTPSAPRAAAPAGPEPDPAPAMATAWIYAVGAVLWLLLFAQTAGVLAASPTRAELLAQLAQAGYTGSTGVTLAVIEGAFMLLFTLGVAAVHAAAFYGLRGRRRWGWVAAVLVAGAWSLVLVGIPVLRVLLLPQTRRAYGITR